MAMSKPVGEGRPQARRACAGSAENMEPGHVRREVVLEEDVSGGSEVVELVGLRRPD